MLKIDVRGRRIIRLSVDGFQPKRNGCVCGVAPNTLGSLDQYINRDLWMGILYYQ